MKKNLIRLCFSIPKDMNRELDKLAKSQFMSKAGLATSILRRYIILKKHTEKKK